LLPEAEHPDSAFLATHSSHIGATTVTTITNTCTASWLTFCRINVGISQQLKVFAASISFIFSPLLSLVFKEMLEGMMHFSKAVYICYQNPMAFKLPPPTFHRVHCQPTVYKLPCM